jgi:hypothetical protein
LTGRNDDHPAQSEEYGGEGQCTGDQIENAYRGRWRETYVALPGSETKNDQEPQKAPNARHAKGWNLAAVGSRSNLDGGLITVAGGVWHGHAVGGESAPSTAVTTKCAKIGMANIAWIARTGGPFFGHPGRPVRRLPDSLWIGIGIGIGGGKGRYARRAAGRI